jgi:hypothetical protein
VQLAALVVVLKVDPAVQGVHSLFEETVQGETRVPAAHTVVEHAVHVAAFIAVEKVEPAIHAVHARLTVTLHAVDTL